MSVKRSYFKNNNNIKLITFGKCVNTNSSKRSNFNECVKNRELESVNSSATQLRKKCKLNTRKKLFRKNENIKTIKRAPLPMKLRAFPQSFWQQPNKTPCVSPGTVYCEPPLLSKEHSSETQETFDEVFKCEEVVSKPNIDLLFSLFQNVEQQQQRAFITRRGRPRKNKDDAKSVRDDDPYLTSSAATSLLLPFRNGDNVSKHSILKHKDLLAMTTFDESASTLTTPVNANTKNFSQILSDLVVQL